MELVSSLEAARPARQDRGLSQVSGLIPATPASHTVACVRDANPRAEGLWAISAGSPGRGDPVRWDRIVLAHDEAAPGQ